MPTGWPLEKALDASALVVHRDSAALLRRRQIVPAAVSDATLITVGLNFVEFLFFVAWCYCLDLPAPSALFGLFGVPVAMVCVMVLAPAVFRLAWSVAGQRQSPGERWLGLNLNAPKESLLAGLVSDLGAGAASTVVTLAIMYGLAYLLHNALGYDFLKSAPIDSIALLTFLPVAYCVCLSFMLSRLKLAQRKRQGMDFSLEAYKGAQRNFIVKHQRNKFSLALAILPLGFSSYLAATAPAQLMPILVTPGGQVLFVELVFWLFWARPLVRYSQSWLVAILYSTVFILPFIAWLVLGPSLMKGVVLPL